MQEHVFNYAICTNVVDGDTIDVLIDVGFDFRTDQRLRLYGIDTPERGRPGFLEAKIWIQKRLAGKTLQVITYKKDSFGRWLALVYADGENVNDQLVAEGLAVPYIP